MRWLVLLAACGDNRITPDAAPDGAKPDLTLVGAAIAPTIETRTQTFAPSDCEVVEQCVDAPGARRLLAFDTVTANLGVVDLVVGTPPAMGVSDDTFVWSPCHGHHHVIDYATYELRDATGVRVAGHKQSFCLHDVEAIRPEAASNNYNCANQGISAGWADIYPRSLSCQWIDVTDLAAGTYTLQIEVNAARKLDETTTANNAWSTTVSL